jgi:hypothetical protein
MSEVLKVTGYRDYDNTHQCFNEQGSMIYVDLLACGTLPMCEPKDLIGKKVQVERVNPVVYVALGTEILEHIEEV